MKKQWIKNAAFLLLLGMSAPVLAQQDGGQQDKKRGEKPQREVPSPENNARHISQEIKKTLNLTEDLYNQIYDLYLTEQRAGMPDNAQGGNMPPRGGMGMPPQGGGPGGPGMDGGMPPQDGNFPPNFDNNSSEDREKQMKEMAKKKEKAFKKLDKKMKKLLTGDQYAKWQTLDTNWREKSMKPQRPQGQQGERPNPEK